MARRIRLLPSGREYPAEEGETLLAAALRAGLDVPYNCTAGTCGACRARVVAGRVGRVEFHDYPLSEAERGQGVVLLCRAHAGGDLVLELIEAAAAPQRQHLTARIAHLERAPHHLRLVLRTPRTQTLRFLAGQRVRLAVAGVGEVEAAVASCPCNGMLLEFHLPRQPSEPLVDHLAARGHLGDAVGVDGPFGRFVLDEAAGRPLVFIFQGTGFAPVKSLVEHAIALEWPAPMHLVWLADASGHYAANLCRSWADALDAFTCRLLTPAAGEDLAALLAGALAEAPPADHCDYYVSGPAALATAVARYLAAAGVRSPRLAVYGDGES